MTPHALSEIRLAVTRELYRRGWTMLDIANLYGVTKQAIEQQLHRARAVRQREWGQRARDARGGVTPDYTMSEIRCLMYVCGKLTGKT